MNTLPKLGLFRPCTPAANEPPVHEPGNERKSRQAVQPALLRRLMRRPPGLRNTEPVRRGMDLLAKESRTTATSAPRRLRRAVGLTPVMPSAQTLPAAAVHLKRPQRLVGKRAGKNFKPVLAWHESLCRAVRFPSMAHPWSWKSAWQQVAVGTEAIAGGRTPQPSVWISGHLSRVTRNARESR